MEEIGRIRPGKVPLSRGSNLPSPDEAFPTTCRSPRSRLPMKEIQPRGHVFPTTSQVQVLTPPCTVVPTSSCAGRERKLWRRWKEDLMPPPQRDDEALQFKELQRNNMLHDIHH
jgi:hypothetical protein